MTCPRCAGPLFKDADGKACLVCGYIAYRDVELARRYAEEDWRLSAANRRRNGGSREGRH